MAPTRRTVLAGIGSATVIGGGATTALADDRVGAGDETEGGAALRVAHASPDAPNVDVYVDGTRVVEDLAFRSVTDYLEVAAGEYEVTVTAAGDPDAVVFEETLTLAAEDYTAVARGELTGETTFTVQVFQDRNGVVSDGKARVRVVHASPDAPAVDVTVNDGALTVFDGVERFTSGGYVEVPAGSYEVEVRPDTDTNDGPVVFGTDLTVEAGNVYTVFAEGYLSPDDDPADEPFGLVPALDRTAPPRGDDEAAADDEGDGDDDEAETGGDDEAETDGDDEAETGGDDEAETGGDDDGPPEELPDEAASVAATEAAPGRGR